MSGVCLHSYRYAWAERAKKCGYPERFAQLAMGHNSIAVHRAYARKAKVELPPLEDYERRHSENKVIPMPIGAAACAIPKAAPTANSQSQKASRVVNA